MKEACRNNLDELTDLLSQMSNEEYSKCCKTLFNASIGQHTRHIIELYLELIQGLKNNEICYDNRARNIVLETDVFIALEAIDLIKIDIDKLQDAPIYLKAKFSNSSINSIIGTTIFRELAYNLEHSIHHQALIKVGLNELGKLNLINENFGVASSTIRFKKTI
jgi:uncharacterized damage-inducible protein DinB